MTAKDKADMKKSINFLVDNKIATSENLKKLEAINYGSNYIEIGWVKRARENLKAKTNNRNIFKHGDEVYFKFDTLKEQNKLLAKQGMEIPWKDSFVSVLKVLPWGYSEDNRSVGANILWIILDLPMSGWYNADGELVYEWKFGYVWSSSEKFKDIAAYAFTFDRGRGVLNWIDERNAIVVRPVLK